MDRKDDALDLEPLAVGHIERSILEDLDLETLKNSVVLAGSTVEAIDTLALEAEAFGVKTRGHLESSGVIGDHGPGITVSLTAAGHGFDGGLAVGVRGVPVGCAAHPIGVELFGSGGEDSIHIGAGEIALTGCSSSWSGSRCQSLDRSVQGVFAMAGGQLIDERSEPVRRHRQCCQTAVIGCVKDRITGLEQRDSTIAGLLLLGESEECLGQPAVGRTVASQGGRVGCLHQQHRVLMSLSLFLSLRQGIEAIRTRTREDQPERVESRPPREAMSASNLAR